MQVDTCLDQNQLSNRSVDYLILSHRRCTYFWTIWCDESKSYYYLISSNFCVVFGSKQTIWRERYANDKHVWLFVVWFCESVRQPTIGPWRFKRTSNISTVAAMCFETCGLTAELSKVCTQTKIWIFYPSCQNTI